MGTDVHLVVVGPGAEDALTRAEARVRDLERRWSRFLPDSEISRLNAAGGKATVVSADTYNVIEQAVQAWHATDGCFDPTVLRALRAQGYDRPFDEVAVSAPAPAPAEVDVPGCAGVELDAGTHLVRLPRDVTIDLGGIGKGAAADLVVTELLATGAEGVCANLGGDVRVEGTPPSRRGWVVGLRCPGASSPSPRAIALAAGAVCTSTTLRRRWATGAGPRHHLIDPRSGAPVDTGLASVTVIGARAVQAEILTKVAFMAGPAGAAERLVRHGVAAVLVLDDGSTVDVGELEEMAA
jgi:thiamine biosynthesis lipoprotein